MEPRKFNMGSMEEKKRWFREMKGYLKTQNFLKEGTDRKGREFAYKGLLDLEREITIPPWD